MNKVHLKAGLSSVVGSGCNGAANTVESLGPSG